ncbi:MAG: GNAT family N-acetyltransferase [Candidatus Marinimicrobia bacterium]|nr:GNAT family N-acetyltransferase [Candidatus Neomarinimicrobiota bacterium]
MGEIQVEIRPVTDIAAQQLEYQVFLEAGYIDPNQEQLVLEYAKYSRSEFIITRDGPQLTGVVRLIYANDERPTRGLPTLENFNLYDEWQAKITRLATRRLGEFGTLAVLKAYRGGRSTYLLKQKLILHPVLKGYRYGVSLIDEGLLKHLVKGGYPLKQIGDKRYYMGSVTVPVLGSVYHLPRTLRTWVWNFMLRSGR